MALHEQVHNHLKYSANDEGTGQFVLLGNYTHIAKCGPAHIRIQASQRWLQVESTRDSIE